MLNFGAKDKPVYKISDQSIFKDGLYDIYESSNTLIPKYVVTKQQNIKNAKEGIYEGIDKEIDGGKTKLNVNLKYVLKDSEYQGSSIDIYDIEKLSDPQYIKISDKPFYTIFEYHGRGRNLDYTPFGMKHRHSKMEIYIVSELKGYMIVSNSDKPFLVVEDERVKEQLEAAKVNKTASEELTKQKSESLTNAKAEPNKPKSPVKKGISEIYEVSSLKGYKSIQYNDIPKYAVTSKLNYMSGSVDFEIYEVSSLKSYKSIQYNDIPKFVISSDGNYMRE